MIYNKHTFKNMLEEYEQIVLMKVIPLDSYYVIPCLKRIIKCMLLEK